MSQPGGFTKKERVMEKAKRTKMERECIGMLVLDKHRVSLEEVLEYSLAKYSNADLEALYNDVSV